MSWHYIRITTKLKEDIIDLLNEYETNEVHPNSPFKEKNTKVFKNIMKRLKGTQYIKKMKG